MFKAECRYSLVSLFSAISEPFGVSTSLEIALDIGRHHRFGGGAGEAVGPFVAFVACMALHPMPANIVPRCCFDQIMPKVGVAHGLFGCVFPSVALPSADPFGDAIANIFAVGVKRDGAGFD